MQSEFIKQVSVPQHVLDVEVNKKTDREPALRELNPTEEADREKKMTITQWNKLHSKHK